MCAMSSYSGRVFLPAEKEQRAEPRNILVYSILWLTHNTTSTKMRAMWASSTTKLSASSKIPCIMRRERRSSHTQLCFGGSLFFQQYFRGKRKRLETNLERGNNRNERFLELVSSSKRFKNGLHENRYNI
jgi:hypothetical protein